MGEKNKPLRFIVMLVEPDEKLEQLQNELNDIQMELYEAYAKSSAGSGTTSAGGSMSVDEATAGE